MRGALVTAAAAIVVTTGGASAAGRGAVGAWPQFRFGPAHTGATPYEHVLTRANVHRLRLAWAVKTGAEVWSSAAVRNGIAYIGSNDHHLYALRIANGAKLWQAAVGGGPSAPAVVGGTVYVRGDNATAYAFDAKTGKRLWVTTLLGAEGEFPAAPTVVGGAVYVTDEGLDALDAKSGKLRWRSELDCFGCPVAFANGTVYIAALDGSKPAAGGALYALDPRSGKPRWTASLGSIAEVTPSVLNGVVYVASALDTASGIRPWAISAFEASTGSRLWRTGIGRSRYLTFGAAAVADGRVVFPSTAGRLVALAGKTGRVLWSVPLPVSNSAPAIANGVVFVGSTDHDVYAFDLRTGRRLWRAVTRGEITSSPTVAGGTMIVGSDDGLVRAFRLLGR